MKKAFINKKKPLSHLSSPKGFTFIELIVVFSIIGILSTIGLASFVDYSRKQTLNSAGYDISTLLNSAKSRSQSQSTYSKNREQMCSSGDSFTGYRIIICSIPGGQTCINNQENYYELDIVCADSINNTNNPIESKKLPSGLSFDSSLTTSNSFLFKAFVGGVDGAGKVVIKGYGDMTKEINVDSAGNIKIQ